MMRDPIARGAQQTQWANHTAASEEFYHCTARGDIATVTLVLSQAITPKLKRYARHCGTSSDWGNNRGNARGETY